MNQKIIIAFLTSAILTLPSLSFAETLPLGEAEIRAKIATLLSEASVLQDKLSTIKAEKENGLIFRLIDSLTKGTRSNDVKTLQTLLAKDSQIYPEAYVTGYYGTLTSAAVERFKKAHIKPSLSVESIGVPHIFGITVTNTASSMVVTWKTNVPTSAKIWWGSPGPLDAERMTPISTTVLSEDHRAEFTGGIFASTTYAFIISASDKAGSTSTTTEQFYVTP